MDMIVDLSTTHESLVGRRIFAEMGQALRSGFIFDTSTETNTVKILFDSTDGCFFVRDVQVNDENIYVIAMAPRLRRSSLNEGDTLEVPWVDGKTYDAMVLRRISMNGRLSAHLFFYSDNSVTTDAVPPGGWVIKKERESLPIDEHYNQGADVLWRLKSNNPATEFSFLEMSVCSNISNVTTPAVTLSTENITAGQNLLTTDTSDTRSLSTTNITADESLSLPNTLSITRQRLSMTNETANGSAESVSHLAVNSAMNIPPSVSDSNNTTSHIVDTSVASLPAVFAGSDSSKELSNLSKRQKKRLRQKDAKKRYSENR